MGSQATTAALEELLRQAKETRRRCEQLRVECEQWATSGREPERPRLVLIQGGGGESLA